VPAEALPAHRGRRLLDSRQISAGEASWRSGGTARQAAPGGGTGVQRAAVDPAQALVLERVTRDE